MNLSRGETSNGDRQAGVFASCWVLRSFSFIGGIAAENKLQSRMSSFQMLVMAVGLP